MKTFRFQEWVRLPTQWIENKGLVSITWVQGKGADYIAALLCLIAIAHRIDDNGVARITYDQLEQATTMSRAKVAAGIGYLVLWELVDKDAAGQSTYFLRNFDTAKGWAKLPANALYQKDGSILAFKSFHLRSKVELHALKLYLLFVSRRDRDLNLALLNYDSIALYSGLQREQIKHALNFLTVNNLIHTERVTSWESPLGKANAYRVVHIEAYRNRATVDIDKKISENYPASRA